MNRNWIWALGLGIVVMLGIVFFGSEPRRTNDDQVGQPILPGLQASLSAVDKVLIKGADGETTLVVAGETWGIEQRNRFAVDMDKLVGFLKSVAKSKLVERKTRKADNFVLLGVDSGGEDALEVQIFTGDDSYSVLVGKAVSNRTGQYIRFYEHESEANQVWLSSQELNASADPAYWLADSVIDIDSNDVMHIYMTHGAETLEIVREQDELLIVDLPEGAELQYPGIIDSLARALADVRMQEVALATEVNFSDAEDVVFELDGDVSVHLKVVEVEERYWLKLLDHEKSKWAFEVTERVYKNLTKRLGDLLKQEQEVG